MVNMFPLFDFSSFCGEVAKVMMSPHTTALEYDANLRVQNALDHMQLSYRFITVCQTIIWHLLSGHVLFRNLKIEADNETTDYKISQNAVQENSVTASKPNMSTALLHIM